MRQANLYLIRHGQTSWNAERRLQGTIDIPLNDQGREEARVVGEKFANHSIAAVYSSPLIRARETAEIIASFHSQPVRCEPDLREGSWGTYDGMPREEFLSHLAEYFQIYDAASLEEKWDMRVAAQADTTGEIQKRVMPCLRKIAALHLGETVVVISHGWAIRSVVSFLLQRDGGFSIGNGALIHLRGDGNTFEIIAHEGIKNL